MDNSSSFVEPQRKHLKSYDLSKANQFSASKEKASVSNRSSHSNRDVLSPDSKAALGLKEHGDDDEFSLPVNGTDLNRPIAERRQKRDLAVQSKVEKQPIS